jgi:uncharacterized protein YjbJ (UPF0337 family)
MTDEDYGRNPGEVGRVLNEPDVAIQPALIWRLTGVRSMDKFDIEDRAASLAGQAEAAVGAFADDVKSQVEGLATQATATAERAYGQARDQVRGAAATVATSVEQQPLIALLAVGLICGTVGFLLGRH